MTRCRKIKVDRRSLSRVKRRRFLLHTLKKIQECCNTMPHPFKTEYTLKKTLLNIFAHKTRPVPRYFRHKNAAYSIYWLAKKTHMISMKCINHLEQTILAQKLMSSIAFAQYQACNRTAKIYCKIQQKIRNQKLVCFIYHCHSFEWKATPSTRKGCYHFTPEEFCSHDSIPSKKQDLNTISTPRLLEQYVAVYDFNKQNKDEIDINAGDSLEVIEKCEDGWWLVNKNSEQGYVPGNYLKRGDSLKDSRTLADNCGEKYVCIEAFEPEGPDDHSLRVGVIVELIQKNLDGWWWVSINEKAGWAPATCLQLAERNVQDRLDNLASGAVETVNNLSDVSNLLKGPVTSVGDSHIISVDMDAKPNIPSNQDDFESDEFSDDNDDSDENDSHYSRIYAPAPKRRNTFKDMKTASAKIYENPDNVTTERRNSAKVESDLEYTKTVQESPESDSENVTNSVKEHESDKNFTDKLQSKLNRNSANMNAAGKNNSAMRPKSIPPPPPKYPDAMAPKKKIPTKVTNEPGKKSVNLPKPLLHNNVPPSGVETVKVMPNAASESNFTDELQSKLTKLKPQQQVSKPDSTAPASSQPPKYNVRQSSLKKSLVPKEKPTPMSPPQPSSLSLASALKQKQNSSNNFQHDITESKGRETESKEKDTARYSGSKLSDRIAKFQNQSENKDANITTGNNRGLNLLKRQQEKFKLDDPNLQDNKNKTGFSSSKLSPAIPQKPPVFSKAALKPTVKSSQESVPANVGLKPKVSFTKPKLNQNVTQSNPQTIASKYPQFQAQKTAPVSKPAQVGHKSTLQPPSTPTNKPNWKIADSAEIKYQASHSYQAENAEEISFVRDDSIEVLEKDESGWWLVRVGTEKGWAPSNYIEEVKPVTSRKLNPPKKPLPKLTPGSPAKNTTLDSSNNNNCNNNTSTQCSENDSSKKDGNNRIFNDCLYIVMEDFSAFSDEELSVEEGMYVNVIDNSNNEWWYVSLHTGEKGWVPANCISTVHDV
ncbi:SH3 and PX domain-containing protein 2A isoform X1 [Octopus sinensis]|uniref:SH3 and PX domain-containing protein 2A isoform X1 n=1 Tax=Octopus sinensis TaxID=2607531 RepID=A0A7E6FBW3_9MOLL|nr:SH3 and PX domain-containing protein 2A isoform X1 [Octopus sinensis]